MPWRVHLCTWRPHSTSVIYTALSSAIFVHALFLWGQAFLSNGSPMSPCRTQHAPILLSAELVRCVQKRRSDRCKYIQTNSFRCPRFSRIDLNENGYRKYLRGDAFELVYILFPNALWSVGLYKNFYVSGLI